MAFASIFVPNFTLQAIVRAEPALRESAVAVIEGNPPLCRVVAVSEKAARVGIECGMSKANLSQFSGVEIRLRSRAQEKASHATLLDIGWSVSPQIEDASEDSIVLDLAGLDRLFSSQEEVAAQLVRRASECGLFPNVAVASNIETALLASRGLCGITVIPEGRESESLSVLPVAALPLSEETAETLDCWGIRTCGDFANLPVLQISERLGQQGVRLHALARGAESRSLVIAQQSVSFAEEMELDDAVEELDPLSFLLGRLLDQLCARLAARSLAAASIRVDFELQPSFEKALDARKEATLQKRLPARYETKIELPVPVRDSKMLLKLLRLRLQSASPPAPIQKIALAAESSSPRATQGGLFLPPFPEPEKLELTIARIANVVGEGNIGSPSLEDTHSPDAFRMQRFLLSSAGETGSAAAGRLRRTKRSGFTKSSASFRAFRPPVPVRVELRANCPARVLFQGLRGKVVAVSGPWRTSGDWWRETPWQQEEWDLEIDFHSSAEGNATAGSNPPGRGLYRLYYDALRQNWFVRGAYD